MGSASESYHESLELLTEQTKDMHRALTSLQEELEAVDWYQQRIDATSDPDLKAILAHNRDEEKEHAAMVLEWIRRRDPTFDEHLRTYLFTQRPVTEVEEAAEAAAASGESPTSVTSSQGAGESETPPTPRLTIGSLMKG